MPRYRRVIRPGDLVHVISRFVDGEYRLETAEDRHTYLDRLGKALARSDWHCVAYALMSTHVHLVLVAGNDPFETLIKSVHAPVASWLNRRQGHRGPVFAQRPSTWIIDPRWAARVIAYLHNNPTRAGVVETAAASTWTSHRAYIGIAPPPAFLSVELGMDLMGFATSAAGRSAFDAFVVEREREPRDIELVSDVGRARDELRRSLRAAVCIAHPRTGPSGQDYDAIVRVRRELVSIDRVVELVARAHGLSVDEVTSSSRRRSFARARRDVAQVCWQLCHPGREIGLYLGISETAVRRLRRAHDPDREARVARVLGELAADADARRRAAPRGVRSAAGAPPTRRAQD